MPYRAARRGIPGTFAAPPQQRIALAVALELEVGIHLKRGGCAELVHDHGVIDHELGGEQRVDLFRVAAHTLHRVAHGGEVHDPGTPVKSCMRTRAGMNAIFVVGRLGRVPAREALDLRRCHRAPVLPAQQVFEQNAERVREARDREAAPLERVQAKISKVPPAALSGARAPKLFVVVIPRPSRPRRNTRSLRSSSSGCPCAVCSSAPRACPGSG